ncbi:MAG TPA: universal stress protein [Thermodesulfobacteriota bacterium]|nr:universal stress protein [Thermodesulfobacteriota bacterium]
MEEKNRRKLKVLVAIDASDISAKVIKRSGQFAKATDCDLTVLTVVEPLPGTYAELPGEIADFVQKKKEEAEEIVAKAQKTLKHYGVDCKTQIGVGPVASEIVEVAEKGNFDVIFVGSRGFGGIKRMLLGSVADDVIRHAHCSVTVVR